MPQNIVVYTAKSLAGILGLANLDAQGALQISKSGVSQKLALSAAVAIKGSPGRLGRIIILAPGSAGSWIFNDCTTTGAATTANQIWTGGFANYPADTVIALEFPCLVGIVCSQVPSAGSPIAVVSYT